MPTYILTITRAEAMCRCRLEHKGTNLASKICVEFIVDFSFGSDNKINFRHALRKILE